MHMNPKYLWLDLETTGLNPQRDSILECAAIITDSMLSVIGEPLNVVVNFARNQFDHQIDDIVHEMHSSSGLFEACSRASLSEIELDDLLYNFCGSFEWNEKPILAGSTPHFDRSFLDIKCKKLSKMLHHRHLDASTLKMAMFDTINEPFKKANCHRALQDIQESLEQTKSIYARMHVRMRGLLA